MGVARCTLNVVTLNVQRLAAYRRRLRWALIGYTAITIVGWAVVGEGSLIAYFDKLIEVALIGLIAIEVRQEGER